MVIDVFHPRSFRLVVSARRGGSGFVLTSVMAIFLILSILITALLGYVLVGLRLTKASMNESDRIRAIDGALETGLQVVREDAGACLQPDLGLPLTDYYVACDAQTPPRDKVAYEERIADLSVEHLGKTVGQARVRIVDLVLVPDDPDTPDVDELQMNYGYSIEVCDWQLGTRKSLVALKGCS